MSLLHRSTGAKVSERGRSEILWLILSACAAFCLTVFVEGVNSVWSVERPLLYNALSGVKALLWLPVPTLSTIFLRSDTVNAYWLFAVWGTVGFLLQTVAHWLRVSQERTIERAFDEWMLVSDRRYWELEHKSASGVAGRFWSNLTSFLIYSWAVAFSVALTSGGSTSPGYRYLGLAIAVFSAVCLGFTGLRVGTDLTRRSLPTWVHVLGQADVVDALARIVVLGLITGWLIVMGLVY